MSRAASAPGFLFFTRSGLRRGSSLCEPQGASRGFCIWSGPACRSLNLNPNRAKNNCISSAFDPVESYSPNGLILETTILW